jgi:hypothetical protein
LWGRQLEGIVHGLPRFDWEPPLPAGAPVPPPRPAAAAPATATVTADAAIGQSQQ